jgi:hypothetical protein
LALLATALGVLLLGTTPVAHTAATARGVPYAKKAGYAKRAGRAKRAKVAKKAKFATRARSAKTAARAANANHATTADHAATADVATTANNGPFWQLTGNAGTTAGTNFLGTTDAKPLVMKTNGNEVMRVDENGNVGIGTQGPIAKLDSFSSTGIAMLGTSTDRGVVGRVGFGTSCPGAPYGVGGCGSAGATGVRASSDTGIGVSANSTSRAVVGTLGETSCAGTYAVGGCGADLGNGVIGDSSTGIGVIGDSSTGIGVRGFSGTGVGVLGDSSDRGVIGTLGRSPCPGTYAVGGCAGSVIGYGVYGKSTTYAGYFQGNVNVTGTLTKGAGAFRIDHPLDPERRYLQHSFVESPEMKNVYDGIATTDSRGFATVRMPSWFQALNRSFRYQLTILGHARWGTQARVWDEIAHNRFTIRTNRPRVRVSWQVTGVRHDPYANAHRIPVVVPKAQADQGTYLHPELYGKP